MRSGQQPQEKRAEEAQKTSASSILTGALKFVLFGAVGGALVGGATNQNTPTTTNSKKPQG